MRTILVTGSDGVIGSEAARLLAAQAPGTNRVVLTTRRGQQGTDRIRWNIGAEPVPKPLRRHWDVIVHLAASTRWTMTRAEAEAANVATSGAVAGLADRDTHMVHVSTAYIGGRRNEQDLVSEDFAGYRNGYEWSKALAEQMVADQHPGPLTVIRPPLVLGRRADGAIARFSGPYTLMQALVSGLAAVVVGTSNGFAEIAPVDDVARCVMTAALRSAEKRTTEVIAGGEQSLRLGDLLQIACSVLNEWRQAKDLPPIATPPIIPTPRWRRFYLPFARQELSEVQNRAVDLLGMFESYTSMDEPFTPTWPVVDPASVLARSVLWWANTKPRLASRTPLPWALIGA